MVLFRVDSGIKSDIYPLESQTNGLLWLAHRVESNLC